MVYLSRGDNQLVAAAHLMKARTYINSRIKEKNKGTSRPPYFLTSYFFFLAFFAGFAFLAAFFAGFAFLAALAAFATGGFGGKVDCKQWADITNYKNLPTKKKQEGLSFKNWLNAYYNLFAA